MKYARMLVLLPLALVMAAPACSIPEIHKVSVTPTVPIFVNYTLNCTADMQFENVWESNSEGSITGTAAIRTDNTANVPKGSHQYLWPGITESDDPAPLGYYVCKLQATAFHSQLERIIGTFPGDDWDTEYNTWVPPIEDGSLIFYFYGVSVNRNPNSLYYGRLYAPDTRYQEIFMYDCDGTYLGPLDDTGITWGPSAPWDLYVAEDGYVYQTDRSNTTVYCFPPDGGHWLSSGPGTTARAMFARQTPDGVTHIYNCNGSIIHHSTVSPDHLTWSGTSQACNPADEAWGLWVSPDLSYMFICEDNGSAIKIVTKWNKVAGYTYTKDTAWSCPITNVYDVCETNDGYYLWLGRMVSAANDPLYKFPKIDGYSSTLWTGSTAYSVGAVVRPTSANGFKYKALTAGTSGSTEPTWPATPGATVVDGSVTWEAWPTGSVSYDGPQYIKGVQCDAVGNILLTYGKSASSWASWYWALATEPGAYTAEKQTAMFHTADCWLPIVYPTSVSWNPPGCAMPDGVTPVTVTFKVMDPEGWEDIQDVRIDLKSVKMASDPNPVVPVDSIVEDTSDPCHQTAICTKTFTIVQGARAGIHQLGIEARDSHYPSCPPIEQEIAIEVCGATFSGTVKHTRHHHPIAGATITIVGGAPGVYGYPFTYTTALTDLEGEASTAISQGSFTAFASKQGYKTQSPNPVIIPLGQIGGSVPVEVWLGPLTIAEAKMLPHDTIASVEGVCFAQPKGLAPTAACGLDDRLATPGGTAPSHQWYMCDPNTPSSGSLFMLRPAHDPDFPFTWHDPSKVDDFNLSVYIGPRPAEGDTICVTARFYSQPSQEKRFIVKGEDFFLGHGFDPPDYTQTYMNLGDLGGLASPGPITLEEIQSMPNWGKFAKIQAYAVGTHNVYPDGVTTWAIADSLGYVTLDTPGSLCMPSFSLQPGGYYAFMGAVSQGPDGSEPLRIRSPEGLDTIRGHGIGYSAVTGGVVTRKADNYLYIEAEDRSIGVRVAAAPSYVHKNDRMQFAGTLGMEDGEKIIAPTTSMIVTGSGNVLPLVMRTADVGGASYGLLDPGITNGQGPLNVGLLTTLFGIVTARDPGGQWFYVWDGANRGPEPLGDGTGNLGVRVISNFAVVPDVDFVMVTGVVSTNATEVTGSVIPEILPTETPVKITP